jgi:hypothetical protein
MLADMRDRDRLGRERYGQPLQAGNGRRHLIDAYQETLDKIVYLRAWLDENGVDLAGNLGQLTPPERFVVMLFNGTIFDAAALRDLIELGL